MTQYHTMLIYSLLLFAMTTFRNWIQDGMKFYCPCQRFHPMTSWKVCTHRGYVSLRNSNPYWNCTTWRFIRRKRFPNYQNIFEKKMVKRRKDQKRRLRNFDARHGRIETGAVVKNRKGVNGVEGGKGICYQWEEKGECSKEDLMQFPSRKPRSFTKTRTHCRHAF